jgi:hypothetical protein
MPDNRDLRSGTYDPGSDGARRPRRRAKQRAACEADRQQRAPVRLPARRPQPESPLPQGLQRRPKGPYGPTTGRKSTSER